MLCSIGVLTRGKMTNNKELEAGLKAMTEDFRFPGGGRKKLAQLVAGHLGLFDAAERRGMGWLDMIRALTAAGITAPGGKPISVGTLSSTVWRKRADAGDGELERSKTRQEHDPLPRKQQNRETTKEEKHPSAVRLRQKKHKNFTAIGDRVVEPAIPPSLKKSGGEQPVQSKRDVLSFMDRARAVRRRSEVP